MKNKTNTSYLDWLHALAVKGYDDLITISSEHGTLMEDYYNRGLSIEDALIAYKSYLGIKDLPINK